MVLTVTTVQPPVSLTWIGEPEIVVPSSRILMWLGPTFVTKRKLDSPALAVYVTAVPEIPPEPASAVTANVAAATHPSETEENASW